MWAPAAQSIRDVYGLIKVTTKRMKDSGVKMLAGFEAQPLRAPLTAVDPNHRH